MRKKFNEEDKYCVFSWKNKEKILVSDYESCINYLRKYSYIQYLDMRKEEECPEK